MMDACFMSRLLMQNGAHSILATGATRRRSVRGRTFGLMPPDKNQAEQSKASTKGMPR